MITISCRTCSKTYRIPSEKFPEGKRLTIPCPNCKAPIHIQAPGDMSAAGASIHKADARVASPAAERPSNAEGKVPLTGEALRKKIIQSLNDLPPMPQVVSKAQAIMAKSTAGIKELTEVIETDQAIASTLIRLANSAFYGLSGKVSTVQKATAMLGQKTLREILMTAGYAELLGKRLDGYGYASGDLWRHAMAVGIGSRYIAEMKHFEDADGAYLAGLLHDSGKLVLDPYVVAQRAQFDSYLADESRTFLDAEKAVFGFDHADIVSDICRKWKIPDNIILAVRYHHRPTQSSGNVLAYIVNVADHIAKLGGLGISDDDYLLEAEEGLFDFLELTQSEVQKISMKVIETMLKFQD